MIIQEEENSGDYLARRQHPQQNRIFMEKTHAVYLVGSAGCGVLRVASSKRNNHWNSLPNTIDEIEASSKGKTPSILYAKHDKIILLHDNTRPHCVVRLSSAPVNGTCSSEQRFTSYEDTKNWVDSWIASKDKEFSDLKSERCLKDGKK
ncbi:hypothetical protein EVAR_10969_1 [Eumeta japonica]|uniref:Mariner Mos1 transposase n=1 Tax=Eumeta variegata TaxID=151549 RepID=A0A4C1U691_EUMVA|nr:hypothetical protein EVAR_10969_1 [Eumeta japonica]